MIGIIGAMEEEVKALLDKTEDIHENKILDCVFYEGKIDNKARYSLDRCIEEMYKDKPFGLY